MDDLPVGRSSTTADASRVDRERLMERCQHSTGVVDVLGVVGVEKGTLDGRKHAEQEPTAQQR